MLERIGRGKGCTYQVPAAMHSPTEGRDSEQRGKDSEQSGPGSEQTRLPFEQRTEQSPPAGEQAPPVGRQWARREQVEAKILALCRARHLTIAELSENLGRTKDTIRVHYVRPMLRRGLLEQLYSDHPRHPRQAYRAVASAGENER